MDLGFGQLFPFPVLESMSSAGRNGQIRSSNRFLKRDLNKAL